MVDLVSDLRQIFAPAAQPLTRGGKGGVTSTLQVKTPVVLFPKVLTPDQTLKMALAFALLGTDLSATSLQWKSYVASYTCLLFRGFSQKLPKDSFEIHEVTIESVQTVLDKIDGYQAVAYVDEADNALADNGLDGLSVHRTLPTARILKGCKWVGAECTAKHAYCHYALVVFLISKQVGSSGHDPIAINRPRGLIQKYSLDDVTMILNGDLRMSNDAHVGINVAWNEMSAFRAICMREFATFGASDTDMGQDIVFTNVRLMRYGQMVHSTLIYRFIQEYPWVAEFPGLRGQVAAYKDSIRAMLGVDATIRPFVKLIWGDKTNIFPRKEMEGLVACALSVLEETNDTLKDFYRSALWGNLVESFQEERLRRERVEQGGHGGEYLDGDEVTSEPDIVQI